MSEKSFIERYNTQVTHLLSVDQLRKSDILSIVKLAKALKSAIESSKVLDIAKGKILINLFYEPSTRTSCSFQAAMLRLGGSTIVIDDVSSSSVAKGETVEDTIQSLSCYGDIIAMRHPTKGAVAKGAAVSSIPIINAGDGAGEHPSQALLDLYTLFDEFDDLSTLHHITMLGDLKFGRTVHSLSKTLALFSDISITCVSPPELSMPEEILEAIHRTQPSFSITQEHTLKDVLSQTDALYVTRIQKERFNSVEEYNKVKDEFIISKSVLENQNVKSSLKILHPLPRVNELSTDVDNTPYCAYFRQMKNGLWVRMSIICHILGLVDLAYQKIKVD